MSIDKWVSGVARETLARLLLKVSLPSLAIQPGSTMLDPMVGFKRQLNTSREQARRLRRMKS